VHLPRGGLEVDGVVRDHAREALRDPAHRNRGRGAGIAGASLLGNWTRGLLPHSTSRVAGRARPTRSRL
jgi:hypothetical protein